MPPKVPRGFWKLKENQKKFLDKLGKELGIKGHEDWYNITTKEVEHKGGTIKPYFPIFQGYGLLEQHNHSLARALQYVYPVSTVSIIEIIERKKNGMY